MSALLESLFLNTPCGSFVFWRPNNPLEFGEPLVRSESNDLKYLIVDGQQRIRTLVAALDDRDVECDPDESESKEPTGTEEKGPKCWCINLTGVEELAGVLKPFGKDYSLFLRTTDPLFEPLEKNAGAVSGRRSPLHHNIVPLRAILDSDQREVRKYEALLRRSKEFKEKLDKDLRPDLDRLFGDSPSSTSTRLPLGQ